MKKTAIILCVLAFTNSWASPVNEVEFARCAAETNAIERLECFDTLAEKAGATASTTNTTTQGTGKWTTSTRVDPLTDKSVYMARLEATTGSGRFGDTVVMFVRCKDNKTEMYIDWKSFLGTRNSRVTHRVGKGKATTSPWGLSTDNQATFYPASPIPLLKGLIENESFVANVTPYNESPVTAVFNTAGAEGALADIRKGCSW